MGLPSGFFLPFHIAEICLRMTLSVTFLTKKVLSVAANLTERADTRCWRTLPDEIRMIKISLPQSEYDITLQFKDEFGNVLEERTITKQIRKNKKTFTAIRTAR